LSMYILSISSDMAHTVSINKIPSHQYNITVKSTRTLQFWCISRGYSNLWCSQWEFQCEESWPQRKTIITSQTNINQYEPSQPRYYIFNYLFHHSLAHYLVLFQICSTSALLYYLSLFICDVSWKILKRATDVILSSFSLLLSL
jgi:hypothetical protein